LNLKDLSVFIAATEYNSFSLAAKYLHMSQPAVSQAVGRLEGEFGLPLFERQGRGLRLTDAGQALRPMASELLANAIRLEETMHSLQGVVVGEMRIGCSTASGKYRLPGLIASFQKQYPQVRVNVLVSSRQGVLNRLLDGSVAFSVVSKKLEHNALECQPFFTDDVILIVAADHPWARTRRIYPDDLLEEPMILREESAGTREVLMDALRRFDISPDMLNVVMELGNAEAIEMAVEEGIGIAFVSRLAASRGLDLGRVVEVEVEGMVMRREIMIMRNRIIPATRSQTAFWEFLQFKK